VVGTVGNIAERVREAGIGSPALTVVGGAVRLRETLRWFDRGPLFGKRVLVTRPAHQARPLSQLLRDAGATPIEAPTIRIVAPEDPEPLREAVAGLRDYDWVLLTSRNGVDALFAELDRQGGDVRRLGRAALAAIGPKTAEALRERGLVPDLVPNEYRGEAVADAVVDALGASARQARVLLPRAREAREVLPERLRAAGATVDVVEAYRTVLPPEEDQERIRQLVRDRAVDVLTFTASSTVRQLVEIVGPSAPELLRPCTLASIGPITTETAEGLGLRVDVTASRYTVAGLVQALHEHFE
jgi:uroporphyrinogen III methyltransferase/synthase